MVAIANTPTSPIFLLFCKGIGTSKKKNKEEVSRVSSTLASVENVIAAVNSIALLSPAKLNLAAVAKTVKPLKKALPHGLDPLSKR